MIEGIPKVSVLIICYNQEKVISRAIESLLEQREYIYEICISDDCSIDNTWEVINDYDNRVPGLFKIQRHAKNVGIFENIESTWGMPSGDLIYNLSGDDECGVGWLKHVIDYIVDNNIDYIQERVCIYGDYECRYPTGDIFVYRNDAIQQEINPLRLAIRGLICNRSAVYSKAVLDSFVKVSLKKSHVAELALDIQLQLFTDVAYYLSYVGNIYYTRIGVSANLSKEILVDREGILQYAKGETKCYVISKIYLDNGKGIGV